MRNLKFELRFSENRKDKSSAIIINITSHHLLSDKKEKWNVVRGKQTYSYYRTIR